MCSDVLPSNYHSSLSQLSNHGGSPRLQQYILVNQPTLNHYSPNLFYSLPNNQWHCPTRLFCPFIRHCPPESHHHQRHKKTLGHLHPSPHPFSSCSGPTDLILLSFGRETQDCRVGSWNGSNWTRRR
jgi:hypothetical protein